MQRVVRDIATSSMRTNRALEMQHGALLIAAIECGCSTTIQFMLSTKVMVRLGILSYGIYLWHIPLLQLVNRGGEQTLSRILVAMGLAVVLAQISYRYCEVPIRDSVRRRLTRKANPAAI